MFLKRLEQLKLGLSNENRRPIDLPDQSRFLGNIRCHKSDEFELVQGDELPIPPLACNFSRTKNNGHILGLVDEDGSVSIYNTNKTGADAIVEEWTAHSNAIFDVEWLPGEDKLLTASGDQSLCLWDANTCKKLLTFKGHTSSVRSVACLPYDKAVFVSGSRDGHARLWDSRCNIKDSVVSSVNVVRNAHAVYSQEWNVKPRRIALRQQQDSQQSVTCVIFQSNNLLATAGAVDGCVKVWDLRKIKSENSVPVHTFPYRGTSKRKHGYSCLTFDSNYSRLFANCTDDIIYCFDFTTYREEPLCIYKGHRNASFYVKSALSPDDKFLFSGSTDEHAYIWEVEKPSVSRAMLTGARSEISDVAWCPTDVFRLATTSDDCTLRIWRFNPIVHLRKQTGHMDPGYNITGSATLTHRDIGVSADAGVGTRKHTSSPSSKKRPASIPCTAGIKELTPKRARTVKISTPSPSIKMWLKRGVSDTAAVASSSTTDSQPNSALKKPRLELEKESIQTNSLESRELRLPSNGNMQDTCSANVGNIPVKISVKPINSEHNQQDKVPAEKGTIISGVRNNGTYSCKRKLIESSENSPNSKRRRTSENDCKNDMSPPKVDSPRKRDNVLKELNPHIQCTPHKEKDLSISSPARTRLLNPHIGASPTSNLPNLVVDGPFVTTPTRKAEEQKKKTLDWLTQMRMEKIPKSSPKSKSCKKLLEKLNQQKIPSEGSQSGGATSQPDTIPMSPKVKSPGRGTQSITKFLRQPAM